MKRILEMIQKTVLNGIGGVPLDYYLFIIIFFAKISSVLIFECLFDVFSVYQHEILLVEKYTYSLVAGYVALYHIIYILTHRRFPWNQCIFLSVLFFLFAVMTTVINQGSAIAYDYFTKLSIMELMLTAVFMFQVASRLSEKQCWNLITICGKGLLYLILFINAISLLVFLLRPANPIVNILGFEIKLPTVFFDSYGYRQYYRYAGFYSHPNTCGVHCYLAIAVSILLLSRKQIKLPLFLCAVFTSLFLIALCVSRTSIVVLSFMAVYLVIYCLKKKTRSLRIAALTGTAVAAAAVVILFFLKQDRILSILRDISADPYSAINVLASDRLHLAKVVNDMVKTSPWIGVGWNVKILQHDSAHNVFLSVLAWTGIIGLIIFGLLLISVVINGVKTKSIQRNPLLFMILLCVLVQCLFEQGIVGDNRHAYTYLFWLILGYFGRINPQINEQ